MQSNRVPSIAFLIILLVTPLLTTQAANPDLLKLEDILTPSELQAFRQKVGYRERMGVFRDVLHRLGSQISRQTKDRDYAAINRTLLQLRSVSIHGIRQAAESHSVKDARSRKLKRLEIELRRLLESLNDLKLKVHFELRLVYEEVGDRLQDFRSKVLGLLFESSNQSMQEGWPKQFVAGLAMTSSGAETSQRRRRGSGIRGDQFTDAEYEKIQDAQKLRERVKVFIKIAETRLDEIERRLEGRESKGDKENPVEFFTVAQMVHAYDRCLEGIMIFIDEKVTRQIATEKEIKKTLTLLNKQIQDFIPRLEPIRLLAVEQKDEELFIEIRSAIKNSDAALKGSQLGLGAPAKN